MRVRRPLPNSPATRKPSSSFSVASRLKYLRIAVAAAYICGILISPKLWFSVRRSFPRVPLVSGLPAFLSSADYLLSLLLLAALAFSLVSKRPSRYLIAIVVLTALLVLFDQTRLQPWVYQYVVMLFALAWLTPGETHLDNSESAAPLLAAGQLIVVCLYFWSGVQKLNWTFGHEVFPGLLESAGIHLSPARGSYLPALGFVVAICEALIGIALLFRKTRQAAVLAAISMHAIVLLLLIVAWRNSVVWPWNIAMMAMLMLLFWRSDQTLAKFLFRWRTSDLLSHVPKLILLLCGLLPALSFAGWWDLYLSGALYSGNTPIGVMRVSEGLRNRLPAEARQHLFVTGGGQLMLPYYEWSLSELNVPPYPEVRAYRQVARQLCLLDEDSKENELIVRERPALRDGSYQVSRTNCLELIQRTR
ncbi:MAG TPA: hypothetical protein VGN90_06770 [Pyrinomonadaceae bacterium]|nr:hypothetical protein [Pyrinomonadaceae bacterium]